MKKIIVGLLFVTVMLFATQYRLNTLTELKNSQNILIKEIKIKTKLRRISKNNDEKEELSEEIRTLNIQLDYVEETFDKIATGIDVSTMNRSEIKEDSLSDDLQLLIKPLVFGAKGATESMRKKAQLQKEAERYKTQLIKATIAGDNISKLLKIAEKSKLKKDLSKSEPVVSFD
jgi:cell division protein FtsB